MKNEKLYDGITGIREDIVERADAHQLRKRTALHGKKWTALAAIFYLILGGADTPDIVTETASDPIDAAVFAAIMEQNTNAYHKSDFACESHVTLANVFAMPMVGQSTHEVTVYTIVLYQKYDLSAAGIHEVTGSHIPTALTFEMDADGTHTLTVYWIPRDGSYYAPDIREKFPADIAEDALDSPKYILAQMQSCYAQAVEYEQIDTDRPTQYHYVLAGYLFQPRRLY